MQNIAVVINQKTSERFKLQERIASSWRTIGATLGLETRQLNECGRNFLLDEDRLTDVLRNWFDNACQMPNYSTYPRTWKGFYTLLKHSNREEDAKAFFRFLDRI